MAMGLLTCLVFGGCGTDAASRVAVPAESVAQTSTAVAATATSTTSTTSTAAGAVSIVNTWAGPPADVHALPIGTSHVSTSSASIGGLFACNAGNPSGGGAFAVGPWVDEAAGTWDMTTKVSVQGDVGWPMAQYSESVQGDVRVIASNGLPTGTHTGVFPIAADDPAFSYDRNPNTIGESAISLRLPVTPSAASHASCLPMGTIGVFRNGVAAFASLDALNRDAVAYETQDACDGHPERSSTYHYHDVPSCLLKATSGPSTVVGFADDGFPIVVERDAAGNLPANADLDECHGRTSPVLLDGAVVDIYHYSATYEFPYYIGCFRGTPVGR